jgi:hypothetical protein
VMRVATLVCPVSVSTPTFFPPSCASSVISLLVMTNLKLGGGPNKQQG